MALKPLADFLVGVFVNALNVVMAPLNAFKSAVDAVGNVLSPITNALGGLGNALMGLCFAHAAPAAEEFNKHVTDSLSLTDKLSGKVSGLGGELRGLGDKFGPNSYPLAAVPSAGLRAAPQQQITVNPTIHIGSVSSEVDLGKVTNAVSRGVAEALRKRL